MARREDYLLTRSLLTDGTVSREQLSKILLKWHEDSPKTLLQAVIDESLISEEESRGLMMCVEKLAEQSTPQSDLNRLDFFLCQMAIKNDIVSAEVVNEYRKKLGPNSKEGFSTSEALVQEGHIPPNDFIRLKKRAELSFYHRKIVALARGKERVTGVFRSPRLEEEQMVVPVPVGKTRSMGIQKALNRAKAGDSVRIKKRRLQNIPKMFGKCEVIEEIASGGMGTVYKVLQKDLDRILALKVLHEDEQTPDRIRRFIREAEAAGRLKHPNIVGIHEVGVCNGRHFFSMDYVEGVPLSVLIQQTKKVELEDLLNIVVELSRAVHYAHRQGIIHRDLKPANIIIDMDGHPQVTDFGLAKILDTKSRLTQSDTIIGTPFYMAPEQTRGDNHVISSRTDVWALGVILYEMITKKLPFVGRSSIELYHKINHAEPIPPGKIASNLPRELDYIILKAMGKDQEDRYPSAEALADDIEKYLEGKPIAMKEPPRWWRYTKRLFRRHKWFILIAICAIVLGWACGWYLVNKVWR